MSLLKWHFKIEFSDKTLKSFALVFKSLRDKIKFLELFLNLCLLIEIFIDNFIEEC